MADEVPVATAKGADADQVAGCSGRSQLSGSSKPSESHGAPRYVHAK